MHFAKIFCSILCFLALAPVAPATSRFVISSLDQPVLLPPYSNSARSAGITGTIELEVTYLKGKVKAVKVLATDFAMGTATKETHPLVVKELRTHLLAAVNRWELRFGFSTTNTVLVEYRLDPIGSPMVFTYALEYGRFGTITKLIITGSIPPPPAK
jgi:hypothetical protein